MASRALSAATLIESQPDGTQIYYKPWTWNPPSLARLNPWADVSFEMITRTSNSAAKFWLEWLVYNGNCRKKIIRLSGGGGAAWPRTKGSDSELVAIHGEIPMSPPFGFPPNRGSPEEDAFHLACQGKTQQHLMAA